ncbi:glycosyltransferase family 39 protein [Cobetia sp. 3AK]|uniref:ArnT family glycosyltransferase n=1 Tax=Cobetia sp. 3AK TaxID=3040020 RepID=UPI002446B3AE|nr:glycosyltransferase family 39 protein [Cobetia sp. 3AK]MDH2375037.1 glycosyltransferase family 39 protein [Cobetia sp. 3AK]
MTTMLQARLYQRLARHPWWSLALLYLLVSAIGLGMRMPWPADEPRFALNGLEMWVTGHWWLPHRGGELYPDKPPIFMWLSGLATGVSGDIRIGFALPSLVAGVVTLALSVDLIRRLHGKRVAFIAGLWLIATLQFVLQARTAQIDMLVTAFIMLGCWGLLRHALLDDGVRYFHLGCFAMGLGIITKGVGFLPLLMLPFWLLAMRRASRWRSGGQRAGQLSWRELLIGLCWLLAAPLVWVGPMLVMSLLSADPELAAYRDNLLLKQTAERYADSWHHLKPWHYFLTQVIPWAWMPLLLTLPWWPKALATRLWRRDLRVWLPLSGAVLIVVFFSLSPGKRGVYLLPALPLLVVGLAPLLPGLSRKRHVAWLAFALCAGLAGIFLGAALLGAAGLPALTRLAEQEGLVPWGWWGLLGGAGVALCAGWKPRGGLLALGSWLVVFWVLWGTWGARLMDPVRNPAALMAQVAEQSDHQALAIPDFREQYLLQARQPLWHFGYKTSEADQFSRLYAWLQAAPQHRWALMTPRMLKRHACLEATQAITLSEPDEHWALLPGGAALACRGDADAAPMYLAPTSVSEEAARLIGLPGRHDVMTEARP